MNGFVIGVSGGVDSAVTSTLCAKTSNKVLCLEMPILQDSRQENRARKHIEWLKKKFPNVTSYNLSLDKVFSSFQDTLPNTKKKDVACVPIEIPKNTPKNIIFLLLLFFKDLNENNTASKKKGNSNACGSTL